MSSPTRRRTKTIEKPLMELEARVVLERQDKQADASLITVTPARTTHGSTPSTRRQRLSWLLSKNSKSLHLCFSDLIISFFRRYQQLLIKNEQTKKKIKEMDQKRVDAVTKLQQRLVKEREEKLKQQPAVKSTKALPIA